MSVDLTRIRCSMELASRAVDPHSASNFVSFARERRHRAIEQVCLADLFSSSCSARMSAASMAFGEVDRPDEAVCATTRHRRDVA